MPQIAEKVCTFETFRQVALSLWRESRHRDARELLEDCLKHAEEVTSEKIVALSNTLAVVEWSEGAFDKALLILFTVSPLLEYASLTLQWRVYNNRGLLRRALGHYELAMDEYQRALTCHKRASGVPAYEVVNNIAALLVFLKRPAEALPYLDDLLKECDDNLIVAQAEDTRATALLAQAGYREAYAASLRSLNLLREYPDEIKPLENSLQTMQAICIRLTTQPSAEQVRDALAATGRSISRAAQLLSQGHLSLDHSSLAHLIRKKFPELENMRKEPLHPRGLAKRKASPIAS